MKLIIKDIKCPYDKELTATKVVKELLIPKLVRAKILHKISIDGDTVVFVPVNKNKIFISGVENKIPLKADDPRRADTLKKHSRDYLISERLTKKQFDNLANIFNDTLDKLNISANIKLYGEEDEVNFTMIRYDMANGKWPTPNSFPLEV